jgi:hypothetical protein
MPSLTSKLLQATAVTTSATIATFFVWTKHCQFTDLSPATDPIFQSAFYKRYNPGANPTAHDLCIRKIPIFKLKPELVEDAQRGGTKMVEAFCAGVWGGFGMFPQTLPKTGLFFFHSTPISFLLFVLLREPFFGPLLEKQKPEHVGLLHACTPGGSCLSIQSS